MKDFLRVYTHESYIILIDFIYSTQSVPSPDGLKNECLEQLTHIWYEDCGHLCLN
jgi:hypothetical protein